ncbi:hypothetical protein TeGR_g618 [Tetraparma gracilis]|uniref:Uncharacterized protein n=1 Tax=Tetraparma gracilis TaxID=2962635 RepID=A0ABQ6MPN5_9STRA|nr:hypothetical protein TeGR_g618 [Tetraparma gracilis]
MKFGRTREEAAEAATEKNAAHRKKNSELAKNSVMCGKQIKWTEKKFQKLAEFVNEIANANGNVDNWSPVIEEMCAFLDIPNDGPKGNLNRIAAMWYKLIAGKLGGYRAKRTINKWVVVKSK